jgi:hypothetical protein
VTQNSTRLKYLIASLVGAAVLLLVNLLLPLGFDNNIYQAMGWTLYKYGGLPYVASWDHNFPGIALFHASSIALFGNSDLGFKLFDSLIHLTMAGLYYWLITRWVRPFTAFVAVILWTIYYTAGAWGLAGQRDGYAVFFLLIALLCIKAERPKLLLSGVAQGLAIMMRPTYLLFTIAIVAALLLEKTNWKTFAKQSTIITLGIALPWILYLVPYFFVENGIRELYLSIIAFNTQIYSHIDLPRAFFTNGRGALYLLAIIGILPKKIFPNSQAISLSRIDKNLIWGFGIASALSPIVMGKYFSYHFEPLLAIVVGFSAIGLVRLASLFPLPFIRYSFVSIALLAFAWLYYPKHLVRYYFEDLRSNHPLEATYERVLSDAFTGLHVQSEVCAYLNKHASADATIEYSSYFTGLRWRLSRPSATRFTTPVSITASNTNGGHPPFQQEWRKEFVSNIATKRPAYVILMTEHLWWPFVNDYADSTLHRIPGFDSVLQADYQLDTTIGAYALYRARS